MYSKLQEMQKCFDEKDIQMLQDVISKMDPTVGFYSLQVCCFHFKWKADCFKQTWLEIMFQFSKYVVNWFMCSFVILRVCL